MTTKTPHDYTNEMFDFGYCKYNAHEVRTVMKSFSDQEIALVLKQLKEYAEDIYCEDLRYLKLKQKIDFLLTTKLSESYL